jgi:hypothetical protein
VVADDVPGPPGDFLAAVSKMLPHWLVDLSRRKYWMEPRMSSFPRMVLNDIITWSAGRIDTGAIVAAGRHIDDVGESAARPAERLTAALFHAIVSHRVAFQFEGFERPLERPPVWHVPHSPFGVGLFVPEATLARILGPSQNCPWPDRAAVTSSLRSADALLAQTIYRDQEGWLIDERFWAKQVRRCRRTGPLTTGWTFRNNVRALSGTQ